MAIAVSAHVASATEADLQDLLAAKVWNWYRDFTGMSATAFASLPAEVVNMTLVDSAHARPGYFHDMRLQAALCLMGEAMQGDQAEVCDPFQAEYNLPENAQDFSYSELSKFCNDNNASFCARSACLIDMKFVDNLFKQWKHGHDGETQLVNIWENRLDNSGVTEEVLTFEAGFTGTSKCCGQYPFKYEYKKELAGARFGCCGYSVFQIQPKGQVCCKNTGKLADTYRACRGGPRG